ncbi:HEK2 [Candida pseudojiufengensis]|uniref:HEK2 n=1 Tax=Candida pseudojiufengensis TaxID=497109 RepID=UPI002224746F|nr:HEK2 [Candida pseudojiufengensis]KAI5963200.1 HEK2 [Candida pseudojiufengensis]
MTESLFDTNFTSEENQPKPTTNTNSQTNSNATNSSSNQSNIVNGHHDNSNNSSSNTNSNQRNNSKTSEQDSNGYDQSTSLPSINDNANVDALINYRVLVSAKEAGCLIGQNGQVIDSIRGETNTKAGISKLTPGTHERILTVSGKLDDAAKALSYFAQALIGSTIETYNYFPLKQLSSTPCVQNETTILRLLVPNSQMGTLIGSKGARIQQIQHNFGVSMIASKSFLPGSNERLVELQGTVNDLYDAFRVISRCLIEDFSSSVGTTYYIPRSPQLTRKSTATISFPNDMVGALIGKNGSRIQGVRKVSGAMIGISEATDGKDERVFTITGTQQAVEKAKGLLYHNLEREEQRRAEFNE